MGGGSEISGLKIVGGHRALDLVNTVAPRIPSDGQHDYLGVPADLLTWCERTGMADAGEVAQIRAAWVASPAAADRALRAVTEIREALFTVIAAYLQSSGTLSGVRGPVDGGLAVHAPDSELEHLSLAVAAARARSRLAFAPNRTIARSISTSPPALLLPDRAALDAQDLLCRVETARLAMCPPQQGGCGWVFLDHSRNRSRRWCAMDACGSGVKARRLTERRRTTRAAAL